MLTKKEHWNYQHEPSKPMKPAEESTESKTVERELLSVGTYSDITFSDMEKIKNEYEKEPGTHSHEFFVTSEDKGSHGDVEYVVQFKVRFVAPMEQSEIDRAIANNGRNKKKHELALGVYELQMADWHVTKKEMEDVSRAQRKTQYELLKKEFGQ